MLPTLYAYKLSSVSGRRWMVTGTGKIQLQEGEVLDEHRPPGWRPWFGIFASLCNNSDHHCNASLCRLPVDRFQNSKSRSRYKPQILFYLCTLSNPHVISDGLICLVVWTKGFSVLELIGENEVEFDIQVFLNLSGVLYIRKVMELPGWQLGARHQRSSLDSVFSCVMGGPFCCHKR